MPVEAGNAAYPGASPSKVRKIEKILLLNPFVYGSGRLNVGVDTTVSRHAGQEIKTGVTFPIGLGYMAAMLTRAGYAVRMSDPIAEPVAADKIYRMSEWADAIIIPYSCAHSGHIRKFFGDFRHKARIVGGGVAAHIADFLFSNDIADIILNGEPEETIVEIVRQYPDISGVAGILYRGDGGRPVRTPERAPVENLDSLAFPLRDYTDPRRYWDISFFGRPTAWILPTRGCPYTCIFCAQHSVNQKRVRMRSPGNIADELEEVIARQHVTNFLFFDETFNWDAKFNLALCGEILKRRLKIKWVCAARPDCVREDVTRKMKESGCIEMRFGIESANDEILAYLGKNTTVEKMRRGILTARKAGINYSFQCIFGSPMESHDTVRNTMRFIKELRPLYVSFNVLTPLPGSQLFDSLKDRLDLVNGMKKFDIIHTDMPLGKYSGADLARIIRRAYTGYYCSFDFLRRIAEEFIKDPCNGFCILRTLIRQGMYLRRSLYK